MLKVIQFNGLKEMFNQTLTMCLCVLLSRHAYGKITRDVLTITITIILHQHIRTHMYTYIRFKIHFVTFENVKVGTKCQRENNQPCFASSRPAEPRAKERG